MIIKINSQFSRFVINGIYATVIHYSVLVFLMELLNFQLAWVANGTAAVVAISFSFLGNRYFVFRSKNPKLIDQISRFYIVYALIAAVHSSVLYLWTDLLLLKYQVGFIIATLVQLIISFTASKYMVFAK